MVLRISKLSLILNFGQVEAEILGLNHIRGHFHFSHEYVSYYPFSAVVTTLLDFQSIILTSCLTFFDIFITNDQAFTPKNATDIDFFQFFVEITQKNDFKLPENVKTENDPWCL